MGIPSWHKHFSSIDSHKSLLEWINGNCAWNNEQVVGGDFDESEPRWRWSAHLQRSSWYLWCRSSFVGPPSEWRKLGWQLVMEFITPPCSSSTSNITAPSRPFGAHGLLAAAPCCYTVATPTICTKEGPTTTGPNTPWVQEKDDKYEWTVLHRESSQAFPRWLPLKR